jgi:hypothetical protein
MVGRFCARPGQRVVEVMKASKRVGGAAGRKLRRERARRGTASWAAAASGPQLHPPMSGGNSKQDAAHPVDLGSIWTPAKRGGWSCVLQCRLMVDARVC